MKLQFFNSRKRDTPDNKKIIMADNQFLRTQPKKLGLHGKIYNNNF